MKILMTGGPGSGKTTQLNELEKIIHSENKNWTLYPEVSRELQTRTNPETGELMFNPSTDPNSFTKAILGQRIADFRNAALNTVNIFDRGLVDSLAYCNAYKCDQSTYLTQLCQTLKYDMIFYFPFWADIYKQDQGRSEDIDQAKNISNIIRSTLEELNYDFITVPTIGISERNQFIVNSINSVI